MFDYTAVITSYNSEKTISDALYSISNQELPPRDVILVDDHSIDETVAVAQKFKVLLPNFQIIVNPKNEGQSAGRNRAAKEAKTKYLIFFDDDDISLPARSSMHWLHFKSGAAISFVSSIKIYPNDYSVACINVDEDLVPKIQELAKLLLLGRSSGPVSKVFVPASTCAVSVNNFREVSGFDEKLRRLEDVDLALKFAQKAFRFSWTSEIGVTRRFTSNDSKGGGIDMEYEKALFSKYRDILGRRNFESGMIHVQARQLYFSHNYLGLIIHGFKHPVYAIMSLAKIGRFVKRVRHDFNRVS